MVDDALFSVREMLNLLSEQKISIVHKKNNKFIIGQFISENTYVPLGEETGSVTEICIQVCELMIELEEDEIK